jgi:hypothetical protein
MTRLTRLCRIVGVGIAVVTATLTMTQVANAAPAPPTLPSGTENIAVPAGNQVFLVGHAKGVQIYQCKAVPDGSTTFQWVNIAPRADLFGDNGQLVATHFEGPTWKALDGSSVRGTVEQRATPDTTAIAWLRLKGAPTPVGADGGRLGATTYIQRVATTRGLAPAAGGCTGATAGNKSEVGYTADYYFWKATGKP